jgi:hypothetical protein
MFFHRQRQPCPVAAELRGTISFLATASVVGGMGAFLALGSLTLVALRYFWRGDPETKGGSL